MGRGWGVPLHSGAVSDPLVIEARPSTRRGRARLWLRGRRLALAAVIALAEVVAFIVWRPSALLAAAFATILLVLLVLAAGRLRPGLMRDAVWVLALAQGIVVAIPLLVGASVAAALLVGVALIVLILLIALRFRL